MLVDRKAMTAVRMIGHGWTIGRDLRRLMQQTGIRISGPAFYQLMANLEDRGIVVHRVDVIGGFKTWLFARKNK